MRTFILLLVTWGLAYASFGQAGPPVSTNQPASQTVWAGVNVTFTAGIADKSWVTYQWQFNLINLTNIITTVAGNGTNGYSGDGGPATNAKINSIQGITTDAFGNLFIADSGNNRIRMVDTNGIINTVAGNGTKGFSGDGNSATNANLNNPSGVAVDAFGNLFFADTYNYRIRKVSTNGTITTVAGNGSGGHAGDNGPATNANLGTSYGLAFDNSGDLFIADEGNGRIRKLDTNGIITTVAGGGSGAAGGPATNASLPIPYGVAFDALGNLFIAGGSSGYGHIWKVDTNGTIMFVAGNGIAGPVGDGGPATNAGLNNPESLAVNSSGEIFVADTDDNLIRKVDVSGIITTFAGNAFHNYAFFGDGGAATNAGLYFPAGVALDSAGNLLIADTNNKRIRKVTNTQQPSLTLNNVTAANAGNYQVIVTTAGGIFVDGIASLIVGTITNQPASPANLAGTTATFSVGVGGITPLTYQWLKNGLALTDGGNVSGSANATLTLTNIQDADAAGYTVVVSNSLAGSVTSSIAVLKVIDTFQPSSRVIWAGGNLALAVGSSDSAPFGFQWQHNSTNLPDNFITTIAGNGTNGFSGDNGPAIDASLNNPLGVAADASGNIFIADLDNNCIRKMALGGFITTIAGNGTPGYAGDGGPAASACLNMPYGVALDLAGNLFIADAGNQRVRKVDTNGVITTIAGNGASDYSGDGGRATDATLNYPRNVTVDAAGDLFIVDTYNEVIRKVDTNGFITTVAGNREPTFAGDGGPAIYASLDNPSSVAVDASGNLFIADPGNQRIRKVSVNGTISTFAGNGSHAYSGDNGASTNAGIWNPQSVILDASGNLFIAEENNSRIRMVNSNGIITTVAGKNSRGFSGDGGNATNAALSYPQGLAMDAAGNLFIADTGNQRIRKVTNTQGPALILNAASAGNYRLIVTGPGGSATSSVVNLILTTTPLIYQTTLNSDGSFALSGVNPPGSTNLVLCATNLTPPVVWLPVSTNCAGTDSDWQFTDTNSSGFPTKFYRTQSQ